MKDTKCIFTWELKKSGTDACIFHVANFYLLITLSAADNAIYMYLSSSI